MLLGWGVGLGYLIDSSDNANDSPHMHVLTHNAATKATCVEEGASEYWYCSGCGKYFSDAAAENEVSQSSLALPLIPHTLVHTNAAAATCTEGGNIEYWQCTVCGKYFSDEGATSEVSQNSLGVAATGHNFVDGVCTVCGVWDESITFYYNILKSFAEQGGFSVLLDNDNTSITYMGSNSTDVYTFNSGELTLRFGEDGVAGWMSGEMVNNRIYEWNGKTEERSGVMGETVYFNNGVVYVELYDDDDVQWVRMSIDEMMASVDESAAVALMINANIISGFTPLIEEVLSEESVESALVDEVLERVFNSVFTLQTEDDKVILSLDAEALTSAYSMLSSSTISEIIDYYLGDGTFAWAQDLVECFDTWTLEQLVTYAEDYTMISREEVIQILNNAIWAAGYENIDISEYLSLEMLSLTVDQAVSNIVSDESFVLSEFIGNYLGQFEQSTPLDLLESAGIDTSVITENAEYYINLAASIADVKLITDRLGNLQTIDIAVNYNGELEGEEHFKIVGGLQLINGGETDDGFVGELVEKVDGLYGNILVDGYYMDNISTGGEYAVDDDVTVENNSYAVLNIAEDGSYTLTVNWDVVVTQTYNYDLEDYSYTATYRDTYKGQYVLTDVMCYDVSPVYKNGELVEGEYRYYIKGNVSEGSVLHISNEYDENGNLIYTDSWQSYLNTSLRYCYSENSD